MGGKLEWVEILEPRSGEPMFVNLITGECGWDEPFGVAIKRLGDQDGHQWWELFDVKTSRFYYYNVMTQQTCWQKPKNSSCIIIPLAKFQLLRQQSNTTIASSTSTSPPPSSGTSSRGSTSRDTRDVSCQTRTSCISTVNSSTQTTPPPSLKRQMCYGMANTGTQAMARISSTFLNASSGPLSGSDTWSTKRSIRTYLINEARSARGLNKVNAEEVSDYDEDFWESEDDEDFADDSSSDQWDADDEIDHEDDEEDNLDDEEEDEDDDTNERVSKLCIEKSDSVDTTQQSSLSTLVKLMESRKAVFVKATESSKTVNTLPGDRNNNTNGKKESTERDQVDHDDEDDDDDSSDDEDIDDAIGAMATGVVEDYDEECETDADIRESLKADSSTDNHSNYGSTYIDTSFVFVKPSNLNTSQAVPAAPPVVPVPPSRVAESSDHQRPRHPHHITAASKSTSFNGLGQFGLSGHSSFRKHNESNERLLETVSDDIINSTTTNGVSYAVVDKSSKHSRNSHSNSVTGNIASSASVSTNMATSTSSPSYAVIAREQVYNNTSSTSKSKHHHHHHHHHHHNHSKSHSSGTNVPPSNDEKPLPPPHQVPIPPQRAHSLTAYDLSLPAPPKSSHQQQSRSTKGATASHDKDTDSKQYNSIDHHLKKKSSFLKSRTSRSSLNETSCSSSVATTREQIMEKFARENVARHIKRGVGNQLLKRKTSLKAMLSWSKNSIKQPMIATLLASNSSSSSRNDLKNECIHCFKLIQMYMGDRAIPESRIKALFNDSSSLNASNTLTNGGQVVDPLNALAVPGNTKESLAFDLITAACNRHELRDEIYVQLCRQTTNNPRKSSLISGLELMACCLCYFPPSVKFSPYLASFLTNSPLRQPDESGNIAKEDLTIVSLLDHCYKLLAKMRGIYLNDVPNDTNTTGSDATTSGVSTSSPNSIASNTSGSSLPSPGGFIYCRKPVTPKEIEMVREAIDRRFTGIFGESLENLIELQRSRWPHKQLPWILTTLCEAILKMGGVTTEGIFRIAADTDELSFIKLVIDCIKFDLLDDDGDILDLLNHSSDEPVDVHVFACLLKQWFRSLREPVIPTSLYESCLQASSSSIDAIYIVTESLPPLNKLVLGYLIRFLQVFSAPENASFTKMDQSNLSMVWSPNILRSPFLPVDLHPSVIFENTRKEMTFIRTLIQSLDTSFIQGVC